MTDNMSHDDYVAFQRRRAAAIASEMLCGAMGMIEGSRSLLSLRPEVEVAEDDPDFRVFIAIVGEERRTGFGCGRAQSRGDLRGGGSCAGGRE